MLSAFKNARIVTKFLSHWTFLGYVVMNVNTKPPETARL